MFFFPMNSPPPGRRSHSWTPCYFFYFFSSSGKLIGNMQPDSHRKTAAVADGKEAPVAFLKGLRVCCLCLHGDGGNIPSPTLVPPSLRLRSSADTWLASRNQAVAANIRRGGGKLCGCASTFIFFITKPALTQIMERTGSLSERQ